MTGMRLENTIKSCATYHMKIAVIGECGVEGYNIVPLYKMRQK